MQRLVGLESAMAMLIMAPASSTIGGARIGSIYTDEALERGTSTAYVEPRGASLQPLKYRGNKPGHWGKGRVPETKADLTKVLKAEAKRERRNAVLRSA